MILPCTEKERIYRYPKDKLQKFTKVQRMGKDQTVPKDNQGQYIVTQMLHVWYIHLHST